MAPSKGTGAQSKAGAPKTASDAEIATNKALLFHAEAARLAKSWLRGATTTGDGGDDHEDDRDQDKVEEDLERAFLRNKDLYSETGGVGYHPPTADSSSTSSPGFADPTTAFLRKQLLGGHQRGRATNGGAHAHNATTARPRTQTHALRRGEGEENSDEEESRSGVGKRKRKDKHIRVAVDSEAVNSAPQIDQVERGSSPERSTAGSAPNHSHGESDRAIHTPKQDILNAAPPTTSKKRGAGSYLDELLASRAAKKQKRENKKKGKSLVESTPG